MTYDAFLEQMKKDLEFDFATELPAKYSGVQIGIRDVEKLQGESYRGISFKNGDSPVEGNMNMQLAYEAHEAGRSFADILHETERAIMQQVDRMPQFDLGVMSDYQAMKPKLMTELIPQKGNEEKLADVPHEKIEDLALIYRLDLGERNGGRMTSIVTNQMMEQYGITQEQLHQDAVENAAITHPASLRSMREVMAAMMGMEPDPPMPGEPELMVATTQDAYMGASVIQYPGFMDMAAEKIGGDFFMLPSSIHEGPSMRTRWLLLTGFRTMFTITTRTTGCLSLPKRPPAGSWRRRWQRRPKQETLPKRDPPSCHSLGRRKRRPWSMHRKPKRRGEPFPKQRCKNQYRYLDKGAFDACCKRRQTFPFLMRRKGRRIT